MQMKSTDIKSLYVVKFGIHHDSMHLLKPDLKKILTKFKNNNKEYFDINIPQNLYLFTKWCFLLYYGIDWDISDVNLCPTIPNRAQLLHKVYDLLSTSSECIGPENAIFDVGVGANLCYPLIGSRTFGWTFYGSDIDVNSVQSAQNLINKNQSKLNSSIHVRFQLNPFHFLEGVYGLEGDLELMAVVVNPPFHSNSENKNFVHNMDEVLETGSENDDKGFEEYSKSKRRNIINGEHNNLHLRKFILPHRPILNATEFELSCKDGELGFLKSLFSESVAFFNKEKEIEEGNNSNFNRNPVWFAAMVSSKDTVKSLKSFIVETTHRIGGRVIVDDLIKAGKTKRWMVGWTLFREPEKQVEMRRLRNLKKLNMGKYKKESNIIGLNPFLNNSICNYFVKINVDRLTAFPFVIEPPSCFNKSNSKLKCHSFNSFCIAEDFISQKLMTLEEANRISQSILGISDNYKREKDFQKRDQCDDIDFIDGNVLKEPILIQGPPAGWINFE